jgi:hypothetical protein
MDKTVDRAASSIENSEKPKRRFRKRSSETGDIRQGLHSEFVFRLISLLFLTILAVTAAQYLQARSAGSVSEYIYTDGAVDAQTANHDEASIEQVLDQDPNLELSSALEIERINNGKFEEPYQINR